MRALSTGLGSGCTSPSAGSSVTAAWGRDAVAVSGPRGMTRAAWLSVSEANVIPLLVSLQKVPPPDRDAAVTGFTQDGVLQAPDSSPGRPFTAERSLQSKCFMFLSALTRPLKDSADPTPRRGPGSLRGGGSGVAPREGPHS